MFVIAALTFVGRLVSYLFRTTGQVLGVSLSGALAQGILRKDLRERIHIPDAEEARYCALDTSVGNER